MSDERVKQIVGEIAAAEYEGNMKAIVCAILDRDGDVRTLCAYAEGEKLPLIAATMVLQHQIVSEAYRIEKDHDK